MKCPICNTITEKGGITLELRVLVVKRKCMLILLLSTALLGGGCSAAPSFPRASGGVIDLRQWDFSLNGPVDLAGDWHIYWEQLVRTTGDGGEKPKSDGFFPMPGTWNEWPDSRNPVGGTGFATFTLKILLPPEMRSAGLWIPNASTAYELWINGEKIESCGTVGTSREASDPAYRMRTAHFETVENRASLLLQVSNFHHRRGGMWKPLQIGTVDQIDSLLTIETMYDLLLFGSFLMMGIYNLFLFLRTPGGPRAALLLSAMFWVLALRVLLLGQMLITQFLPDIQWLVQLKTEYLTSHAVPVLFIWALDRIYPGKLGRGFLWSMTGFVAFNSLVMLATPVLFYSRLVLYFLMAVLTALLYAAVRFIAVVLKGDKGALIIVGAVVIFFLIVFGETIHYRELILSRDFTPFGFLVTLILGPSSHSSSTYLVSTMATLLVLFISTNLLVLKVSSSLLMLQSSVDNSSSTEELIIRYGVTPREAELLELVARGYSNKEIAAELFISEGTVKNHLHHIMTKLRVRNRTELSLRVRTRGAP